MNTAGEFRLVAFEAYEGCWRIGWEDEDGVGLHVGQDSHPKHAPDRERDKDAFESWWADEVAIHTEGVQHDEDGYCWASKALAARALRIIKGKLMSIDYDRPLEDWEKKALAAGWTPPKKLRRK